MPKKLKHPTTSAAFKTAEEKARKTLAEIYGVEEGRIQSTSRARRIGADPADPLAEQEVHSVRVDYAITIPGPGEEKEIAAREEEEKKAKDADK